MPHYDHPRPMVTVDIFLLRFNRAQFEILLIQRKNHPFKDKWALPGGYVEIEEPLEVAAKRELAEETGMENIPLCKLDVFGAPKRDPRGRTITIIYFGIVPSESREQAKAGDDAASAQWSALNELPQLAFDHDQIIKTLYENFQSNCLLRFWFILLLDKEFSISQVKLLFSRVSGIQITENLIRNILFQLPFIRKQSDSNFGKQISNEELLNIDDNTILETWQKILMTESVD